MSSLDRFDVFDESCSVVGEEEKVRCCFVRRSQVAVKVLFCGRNERRVTFESRTLDGRTKGFVGRKQGHCKTASTLTHDYYELARGGRRRT